ncbi:MAG: helix-turn-helix domain-containing protein [Clostridia bacterium]|nr:helix-turn-helix domain-containing protein [Clostridia bacterium]
MDLAKNESNVEEVIEKDDTLYTLYVHTCLKNDKVYVGITYKDAKSRWDDGSGYKSNFELYSDIKLYGWNEGFHHKVVRDDLSWEKAKEAERFFIEIYDSTNPDKGYNHRKGGIGYGIHRPRENFGKKLKTLRKNKGLTQVELAEILGLSRPTISNYEVNRRSPSLTDLKMFAEFYGVGLDYFGTTTENADFEISTRVIEYFKSEDISIEDKVDLFNDIVTAYTRFILQST